MAGSLNKKGYEYAKTQLGVQEIVGKTHNPTVLEYLAATNLDQADAKRDETAWCSAFVNWCIQKAGGHGTKNALARSWLGWGKELKKPYQGCIVIFRRGKSTYQGHVGFYVRESTEEILVLGGNQGNRVSYSIYKKSQLLGYRESNS